MCGCRRCKTCLPTIRPIFWFAGTQTRSGQISGRRLADDGLALCLERAENLQRCGNRQPQRAAGRAFRFAFLPDDPQRRVIAATVGGVRVINVYCVNGEALDSPKFKYKEQWFAALTEFVRDEMTRHGKLVLLGDFNIAPADADCYDPENGMKNPLFVRRTAVVSNLLVGIDRQPAPSPPRRRVLYLVRLSRRDVPTQPYRVSTIYWLHPKWR